MTYAKHDSNYIFIYANRIEASRLGAIKVAGDNIYKLPISRLVLEALDKSTEHPMIKKLLVYESCKLERITSLKNQKDTTSFIESTLRPYQKVDASIIVENSVLAIFNEQRTGKTPTILSALGFLDKGIIVCPSSLKLNWLNETRRWSLNNFVVISGSKAKRLKTYTNITDENIIISYETLRTDITDILKLFKAFNYLIVDEAHRLRNHKTKQSQALYKIRTLANRVYPMTGTPAVNHPADVYGILKLMYPEKYRSYWAFVERYFTIIDGFYGKGVESIRPELEAEFNELLYTNSLQRKRRDVMSWVPKVIKRTVELEPSPKQLSLFNEIVKKNTVMGDEIPNAITKLTRLRQVCVDPAYFGVEETTPKLNFIKDYIEDNDDTVIVFSTMTQALKRLHEAIPDSVILTGEQTTEEKQNAILAIQTGAYRILFANIRAGGVGFTIDKADTIIFLDKSYTPDENEQASDRFIPVSEHVEYGAKQIITLLVKGSVEPKIEQMLEDKIDIIKYVNDYGIDAFLR